MKIPRKQNKMPQRMESFIRQVGQSLFPETLAHSPATTSWANHTRVRVKAPPTANVCLSSGAVRSDIESRGGGEGEQTPPPPHHLVAAVWMDMSVPQEEGCDPVKEICTLSHIPPLINL